MYVYQITNLINNKIYIGITNNYKKRWQNHKCNKTMVIGKAIQKYGANNFKFEILFYGLSIEEAEKKEISLIKEKDCLVPKGYNVDKGGKLKQCYPLYGEDNPKAILTNKQVQYIKNNRNIPAYVLYEKFSEKINYQTFLNIYNDNSYKGIKATVPCYEHNLEFSCQFINSKIDYGDVVELRNFYKQGVYWKKLYKEKYKTIYENPMTFWNIYNGKVFSLVMPEVFTKENKKLHSSLSQRGESNGKAKLKEEEVIEIRRLFKEGKTREDILEIFPKLKRPALNAILRGETWSYLL